MKLRPPDFRSSRRLGLLLWRGWESFVNGHRDAPARETLWSGALHQKRRATSEADIEQIAHDGQNPLPSHHHSFGLSVMHQTPFDR